MWIRRLPALLPLAAVLFLILWWLGAFTCQSAKAVHKGPPWPVEEAQYDDLAHGQPVMLALLSPPEQDSIIEWDAKLQPVRPEWVQRWVAMMSDIGMRTTKVIGWGEISHGDGLSEYVITADDVNFDLSMVIHRFQFHSSYAVRLDATLADFRYIGVLPSAAELLDFVQSRFDGVYSIYWVEYPLLVSSQ